MKDLFPGYYRPSEDDFTQLWNECIFAFDANVLLDLYRYKTETLEELLTVLESLAPRLWLPYHAAYEYQKNRLTVINTQAKAYTTLRGVLQASLKKLSEDLDVFKKHPFIDVSEVADRLGSTYHALGQELSQYEAEHEEKFPRLSLVEDNIRERLDALFDGKVGQPYAEKRLAEVHKEGEDRYKKKTPPGFADNYKDENKYGDLIVWLQSLEHAKREEKPLVFVTNDNKNDWSLRLDGKTLGPRSELIQEMYHTTGRKGYIYSADQFIKYASDYLKRQVPEAAIEEIKSLGEAQRSAAEIITEDWTSFLRGPALQPSWKELNEAWQAPIHEALQAQQLLRDQVNLAMRQSGLTTVLKTLAIPKITIPPIYALPKGVIDNAIRSEDEEINDVPVG